MYDRRPAAAFARESALSLSLTLRRTAEVLAGWSASLAEAFAKDGKPDTCEDDFLRTGATCP
jgi:hypothetical protein